MNDRPDLESYGKNRKRSGPPADDERDPIDPPRAAGRPAAGVSANDAGLTPHQLRQVSKAIGLQITMAHHQMIEELAAKRRAPLNKKRYVVEAAIEELYRREVGGDL